MAQKLTEIGLPIPEKASLHLSEVASLSGDPSILSEEDAARYLLRENNIESSCTRLIGGCGQDREVRDKACNEGRTKFLVENGAEKYIEKYLKGDPEYKQKLWQEAKRFVRDAVVLLEIDKHNSQMAFPGGCRQ